MSTRNHDDSDGMDKFAVVQNDVEKTAHDKAAAEIRDKAKEQKSPKYPRSCGKCGGKINSPGPCPVCDDAPYGNPF